MTGFAEEAQQLLTKRHPPNRSEAAALNRRPALSVVPHILIYCQNPGRRPQG